MNKVITPGDTWRLGRHSLTCVSCIDDRLIHQLPDGYMSHDLILTDPPYCSGGFQESDRRAGSAVGKGKSAIVGDRRSSRGYMNMMKDALRPSEASYAYVFTDWKMWVWLFDVFESMGFWIHNMLVWDKQYAGLGTGWRAQHELILHAVKRTPNYGSAKGKPATGNILRATRVTTGAELLLSWIVANHPAVFYSFPIMGLIPIYIKEKLSGFITSLTHHCNKARWLHSIQEPSYRCNLSTGNPIR